MTETIHFLLILQPCYSRCLFVIIGACIQSYLPLFPLLCLPLLSFPFPPLSPPPCSLHQTLLVCYMRASMVTAVSGRLWDGLCTVLSSLTGWKEVLDQWEVL